MPWPNRHVEGSPAHGATGTPRDCAAADTLGE